ncbi:MAG: DUF5686 family protein [Bacteroidales bacterium]|nr:DUF5686 family protein [Bacteroidales bacterium]
MKRVFVITILFFLISCELFSQQTIINGKITDSKTNEPIAFVDVYFKNTYTGVRTDFEGNYEIKTNNVSDSVTASFLGYISISKPVKKGETQTINFQLEPSSFNLNEVVIKPGENPAITILKKVWDKKDSHNIDKLDAYQFESYSKVQVYLRRFSNKEREKKENSIIDNFSIETGQKNKPALPVYMTEALTYLYYINFPQREKVIVIKTNTTSILNIETNLVMQLTEKNNKYNFNNNFVKILDKNFISPISSSGQFYYKYYLTDSLFIDGKYCYEIKVVPKRKEDLAFAGTIWINDSTYALKRISVEVGKDANLNFVKRIKIQQDLNPLETGVWMPYKTRILADAVNIFISAYSVNDNIIVNQPKPLSFYDKEIEIEDTAYNKSEELLNKKRPEIPEEIDKKTISNIDSLSKIPRVKFLANLVNASIKGFYNLGKIEIGPVYTLYSNNKLEGNRFRLGFRTNSEFSKRWIFKGFLAYGTKDEKFKYNGQTEMFLSRKSWTKIGLQYSEDVEHLGAVDEFYSNNSFFSFASSFGGSDKMNSIKIARLWFESDLFRGFTQKIIFLNKFYSPVSKDYFFEYYTDNERTKTASDITVSELTFLSIYQPKATFIIDKNERFPVAIKKAPVITFNYTVGLNNIMSSDFEYHKASLEIRHKMHLADFGSFLYDIKASKIFTQLPYPLLITFAGNQSIFRFDKAFNLMNYGEFIADQSLEMFFSYHNEGLIFDRFPLIKKLGLRAVATAHIAYGSFDKNKNGTYNSTSNPTGILPETDKYGNELTGFYTLNSTKPYVEVSYGIENIFRVFRVDFIHRLSYLSNKDVTKFGIKISANFKF